MSAAKPTKTIDQIFAEFLADQEARWSASTYRKYEDIIDLFRRYLESYRPDHNNEEGARAIDSAGGTYCATFGPDDAVSGFSEFLGYFIPRKVIAGNQTMKAAGTVLKKLAKWLDAKGYTQAASTSGRGERLRVAAHDLPASQKLLDLLDDWIDSDENPPPSGGKRVEGHFWISRVEPGRIWLTEMLGGDSDIGPIKVPEPISRACKEDWDLGGAVAKTARGWRLVEVWNISP